MVIAQLRHRYEMIIIDSPPVLPIPDALILGRWTDGALLATRFEVSRSPQVERCFAGSSIRPAFPFSGRCLTA